MERGVLIGVAGLRWAGWVWLAIVTLLNLHRIDHPLVAVLAIGATATITVVAAGALRGDGWRRAMSPGLVGAEVAVAALVVVADGWVRQGRVTGQTLAGTWPLASILLAAVAGGLVWGVVVGAVLSVGRALAVVVAGSAPGQAGRAAVAAVSTGVSWMVIGAVCGTIVMLLRRTQHQLAEAEARGRIASDLHDGVLQTLALIERRSDSPDIARLAHEQERDLRAYLFGDRPGTGSLPAELRAIAARIERAWPDTSVTVTVSDDVPSLSTDQLGAAAGATAEALTNAAKHGRARHAVVFADLDESTGGLFLSVKDDGCGFEPATMTEGVGMTQSIRGRVERVAGRVEFGSTMGEGVEVRIAMPPPPRKRGRRG